MSNPNPFPDAASAIQWLLQNPSRFFESAEMQRLRSQAYEAKRGVVIHPPADDRVVLADLGPYEDPSGLLRPPVRVVPPLHRRRGWMRPPVADAAQAAQAAPAGYEPSGPWSCSACTFINQMQDERCGACEKPYDLQDVMVPEDAAGPLRMFQSEPGSEQLARRVQELEAALQASNRRNEELTRALAAASSQSQENHDCEICSHPYNKTNHRPRSSSCGHTYCGMCWEHIQHEAGSANIKCPHCRVIIARPTAPNYEIESLLHLGLKRKSRPRHAKKKHAKRSRRAKK
jgi:hypothetical protein